MPKYFFNLQMKLVKVSFSALFIALLLELHDQTKGQKNPHDMN